MEPFVFTSGLMLLLFLLLAVVIDLIIVCCFAVAVVEAAGIAVSLSSQKPFVLFW